MKINITSFNNNIRVRIKFNIKKKWRIEYENGTTNMFGRRVYDFQVSFSCFKGHVLKYVEAELLIDLHCVFSQIWNPLNACL